MPTTEAQRKANALNAQHASGPKTPEGKSISRKNGLKHGMTGLGIVMLGDDMAEVDARTDILLEELAPLTEVGEVLVRQVAVLSVRLVRCVEHEVAIVSGSITRALREFDDARRDEADFLFDTIAETPSANVRKLVRTAEGLLQLIRAWTGLKIDLAEGRWQTAHGHRLAHLMGFRSDDCNVLYVNELTSMVMGCIDSRPTAHPVVVDLVARAASARQQLSSILDREIHKMTQIADALDTDAIDRERAEVIARAKLEVAADVHQVHKYESATRASLFRTLKEARLVELAPTLIEQARATQPVKPAASPIPKTASEKLGSSLESPSPTTKDVPPIAEVDQPRTSKEQTSRVELAPAPIEQEQAVQPEKSIASALSQDVSEELGSSLESTPPQDVPPIGDENRLYTIMEQAFLDELDSERGGEPFASEEPTTGQAGENKLIDRKDE